jgi:hypothetical protein
VQLLGRGTSPRQVALSKICSFETSVLREATRRNILEDGILQVVYDL